MCKTTYNHSVQIKLYCDLISITFLHLNPQTQAHILKQEFRNLKILHKTQILLVAFLSVFIIAGFPI